MGSAPSGPCRARAAAALHLGLPRDVGLVGVREALGMGIRDSRRGLRLVLEDAGEDRVVARVEARVLRRNKDADLPEPVSLRLAGLRDRRGLTLGDGQ